ncbi:MAG TPA: energy transducer TonB [Candidatus Cybelea sp.]|jgi:TonB family protein
MLFVITTLALQVLSPALAFAPPGESPAVLRSAVAASCLKPNTDAFVTKAVKPELPHGMTASGSASVEVIIGPDGHVMSTTLIKSTGNSTIDHAAVQAARNSSYSPKIVNCKPVQGKFVFHTDFRPNP